MKICIIVPRFPPVTLGGVEIGTYNLAEELARNHQIIVLTRYSDSLAFNEKVGNFFVRHIKIIDKRVFRFFTFIISSLIQLRQLKDIDVIQAQMIGYSSLTAILSKFLFRIPCIVWAKGSDVYQVERQGLLVKMLFRFIITHADIVVALDENMKREIVRMAKKKDVFIIPEGINLKKFRRKRISTGQEVNLMFIGRLHRVKGVKYLLKAIPLIKKRIKNIKLFIIGTGEEEQKLKKMSEMLIHSNEITSSEIDFVGRVPHDEIPKYLELADILILPSLSEGLPVILLEAMATGVPIVATNVGGVPLLVKDGETGFIVPSQNQKEIAKAVIKILTDQNPSRMSNMAIKYAREHDIRIVAKKVERLYELLKN